MIRIIFIAGPTRSGKSSLSRAIVKKYHSKRISVISLDDYYLEGAKPFITFSLENSTVAKMQNWECIESLDTPEILTQLKAKLNHGENAAEKPDLIIVEGILAFTFYLAFVKENISFNDLNIVFSFIFLSLDYQRSLKRRLATKKRSNMLQFEKVIWPEYQRNARSDLGVLKKQVYIIDASLERSADAIVEELFQSQSLFELLPACSEENFEKLFQMAMLRIENVIPQQQDDGLNFSLLDPVCEEKQLPPSLLPPIESVMGIKNANRNTILGAALASALGDALGLVHEFAHNKHIVYTGKLQYTLQLRRMFNRYLRGVVGQTSDDTESALTTLSTLLQSQGNYNRIFAIQNLLNWCNSGTQLLGLNTRKMMLGVKTVAGYLKRVEKFKKEEPDLSKWSESNGAMMRCWPLALINNDEQRRKAVEEDCSITNPNPVCVRVNTVYVNLVNKLFYKKEITKEDFGEYLPMFEVSCNSGFQGRDVTVNKGHCLNALYVAFLALEYFEGKSYQESLGLIVAMGGDTDTNAAIAGVILGAKRGYSGLVQEECTCSNLEILLRADPTLGEFSPFGPSSDKHIASFTVEKIDRLLEYYGSAADKPIMDNNNNSGALFPIFASPVVKKISKKRKNNDTNNNDQRVTLISTAEDRGGVTLISTAEDQDDTMISSGTLKNKKTKK